MQCKLTEAFWRIRSQLAVKTSRRISTLTNAFGSKKVKWLQIAYLVLNCVVLTPQSRSDYMFYTCPASSGVWQLAHIKRTPSLTRLCPKSLQTKAALRSYCSEAFSYLIWLQVVCTKQVSNKTQKWMPRAIFSPCNDLIVPSFWVSGQRTWHLKCPWETALDISAKTTGFVDMKCLFKYSSLLCKIQLEHCMKFDYVKYW